MDELYRVSGFMVRFFGPLMVACLVLMYISVARRTRRSPRPREVMYSYVRYNMEKRRHAGLLTYLFVLGFIFFVISAFGLLAGYLLRQRF